MDSRWFGIPCGQRLLASHKINQIKAPHKPKLPFDIFPQSHHNTNLENEFKSAPLAPESRRVEVK